ncbi:MAG: methyltransferase domain-containing protein [Alphaproteobacteria bacterium]|nr:methyltransferase domain-containing protein [Alphaproteobacteria bacterium]
MPNPAPFNRSLLRLRRDRAARQFHTADFLKREMAERLAERLDDITRDFPLALDLGCHGGELGEALMSKHKIGILIHADLSPTMLMRAAGPRLAASEEALPFGDNTFDAVFSCMSLHWVNDLPGTLAQIRRILKPDGLFLASFPGGESLKELRAACFKAGVAGSGVSPRVSPFVDVRDAGMLLQRAGFALPVVDADTLCVSYPSALELMRDLRLMGETNALNAQRRSFMGKDELSCILSLYQEEYADAEDRVPASFEIVTLTAWKQHESQQQPAKRGSGQVSLKDVL